MNKRLICQLLRHEKTLKFLLGIWIIELVLMRHE